MKIIRLADIARVPASHEDPIDPGVRKQVVLRRDDLSLGRIQMVNWATIPVGKSFQAHYHESMEEICVVISGAANVRVGKEEATVGPGDTVVIRAGITHTMTNSGQMPVEYLMIGILLKHGGKTVVINKENHQQDF